MIRTISIVSVVLWSGISASVQSQNLFYYTESAAFDSVNNRYLVSNQGNGAIVQVDSNGIHSYFSTELSTSKGLLIQGDTLFVGASTYGLVAFDLNTAQRLFHVVFPGQVDLNDVTADTSGNIYVSDAQGNRIHRLHLSDMSTEIIVLNFSWANGLLFDPEHNRLLACQWINNSPISAIDLTDYSVDTMALPGLHLFDGLTEDSDGNILFSSFSADAVLRYDRFFTGPAELVSTGHVDPGDIYYNQLDEVLVVPNISRSDRVDFVDFSIPRLRIVGQAISDPAGNGDNCAQRDETVQIRIVVANESGVASGVTAEMTAYNLFLTITNSVVSFDSAIPKRGKDTSATAFEVEIADNCPQPLVARLAVVLTADGGYSVEDTLILFIGDNDGFADDMEYAPGTWQQGSMLFPYRDGWISSTGRQHSGTTSFKAGRIGVGDYFDFMDAMLISPPFLLERNSRLRFWHFMDASADTSRGLGFDVGTVWITRGDGEWNQLEPEGGYPYVVSDSVLNRLGAGTACYSGHQDWSLAECSLAQYAGLVQIGFRFTSDASGTDEGWYIDDVTVEIDPAICCEGMTGNVDYDPDDLVDIGDLTRLIDFLFISFEAPACAEEANIDGEGAVDIGDLTKLIDFLFISFTPPAECL
ncbi:MAG: SMP-30/gluconolactonase/LRE family protein [Candidatus Zixiibacteriota bacterium]|nr:MAG: SMP-30/gluconolactonase/LRE family protein [candidate division Zixibacteria bacterium]